jgi:hypothetical protein
MSTQSRLISSPPLDSRHGEKVADHAVEVLGLVLDLGEKVAPGRLGQTGAVVDQARGGAEDRGERRAEVMADRGEKDVAHPLRLGGGTHRVDFLRKAGAFERGARLVAGAAGDRGGEHGHGEQHEQRQELVRLGDRESVQRLDEEEVVGQERQPGGQKRRPEPETRGGEQHRQKENHRDVGKANERGHEKTGESRKRYRSG